MADLIEIAARSVKHIAEESYKLCVEGRVGSIRAVFGENLNYCFLGVRWEMDQEWFASTSTPSELVPDNVTYHYDGDTTLYLANKLD